MTIHERLLNFARGKGLTHVLRYLKDQGIENYDVLLVGSTATGLCESHSDVDLCLLVEDQALEVIRDQEKWQKGKPNELIIDGIQLHFYGTSLATIEGQFNKQGIFIHYLYSTCLWLAGQKTLYKQLNDLLDQAYEPGKVFESSLDMLKRRAKSLSDVLALSQDPLVQSRFKLEVVTLLIKVLASKDGLSYDHRKRVLETGLRGPVGMSYRTSIEALISWVGSEEKNRAFKTSLYKIIDEVAPLEAGRG